jgi:hypothetical protein
MRSLRRLKLPSDDDAQGTLGLSLFLLGVADLLLIVKSALNLYGCDELKQNGSLLFVCLASSIVATVCATLYLSYHMLATIRTDLRDLTQAQGDTLDTLLRRPSGDIDTSHVTGPSASTSASSTLSEALSETTRWIVNDRGKLPLILILSATNFQSLAILRLQLCGHKILLYPMQDRHLHFLRNAGLFKHLVGDIPVALISLVLLYASDEDVEMCASEDSRMSAVTVATAMLCCKVLLIVWSCVKSTTQLFLTGVYGVQQPNGGVVTTGGWQVETTLSLLRQRGVSSWGGASG